MSDLLKQIGEAWSERLRSPFLGFIVLVFITVNWRPLFYLFFADKPARARFLYFEANTDFSTIYVVPIVLGIALALVSPWLKLVGAWCAAAPKRRLFFLQDMEARKRKISELEMKTEEENARSGLEAVNEQRKISELEMKAEEENARSELEAVDEQRSIDRAKRLDEARNAGGENLEGEILKSRAESNKKDSEENVLSFSPLEELIIVTLGEQREKSLSVKDFLKVNSFTYHANQISNNMTNRRLEVDTQTALSNLENRELVARDVYGNNSLTSDGYEIFDELDARGNR